MIVSGILKVCFQLLLQLELLFVLVVDWQVGWLGQYINDSDSKNNANNNKCDDSRGVISHDENV